MDMRIVDELVELERNLNKSIIGFGKTIAVMAELEMMKAANEERRGKGFSDAYGEDAFAVLVETQSSIVAEM